MPIVPAGAWIANRYRVEAFLGDGSFGEVYRVWDEHQGQTVALKLLDPVKVSHWPWHEATQLTRLRSDFILPVWNADIAGGYPYVVTEVAGFGSVGDRLQLGPFTPRAAAQVIREAAKGTARAHDDGIVHRDIKLDNVFLGADGRAVLGDFGLAHPLNAAGQAPRAGTPITMAPEVLAGGATTRASDVYSLGASLYACVTGEYPYQTAAGDDVGLLMGLVAAGPPPPVRDLAPHVSRLLGAIVGSAMNRDPARRPSAAALDAELGRVTFSREWTPAAHPGHVRCWESTGPGSVHVCTVTNGRRTAVEVRHASSARRILAHCYPAVPSAQVPAKLRRIFERLGN